MVNFILEQPPREAVRARAERRACPRPDNDNAVAAIRCGWHKNSEEQAQA